MKASLVVLLDPRTQMKAGHVLLELAAGEMEEPSPDGHRELVLTADAAAQLANELRAAVRAAAKVKP